MQDSATKQTGPAEVASSRSGLNFAPETPETQASIVPGRPEAVKAQQVHFFKTLFGSAQGHLFVWLRERTTGQHGYAQGHYPEWLPTALDGIEQYTETHDIYFCAQLLDNPMYRVVGTDGKMHGPRVKGNVVKSSRFCGQTLTLAIPTSAKLRRP